MIPSPSAVTDFEDQVAAFFRRASSKAEGEASLVQHSASLLASFADLLPTIKECPAYAGMAFYSRLQAVNLKLIKKLAAEGATSAKALDAIRAGKALRVSAAAKPGWDLLLSKDPDSLWCAIVLNFCRKPGAGCIATDPVESDEQDEDGEDQHDSESDQEDEDDDN